MENMWDVNVQLNNVLQNEHCVTTSLVKNMKSPTARSGSPILCFLRVSTMNTIVAVQCSSGLDC